MEPIRDLPMGFGMALLQDPEATQAFSAMSAAQRQCVLDRAHAAASKADMHALVHSLHTPGQNHFNEVT